MTPEKLTLNQEVAAQRYADWLKSIMAHAVANKVPAELLAALAWAAVGVCALSKNPEHTLDKTIDSMRTLAPAFFAKVREAEGEEE